MKIVAPDYLSEFKCIAGDYCHTCCVGWEVDVDSESLQKFEQLPDIAKHIDYDGTSHIKLSNDERCPFLNNNGLCEMIINHGEEILCQICADHPRFRNFWSNRIELGLGLVCEEAGRIILGRKEPMKLVTLSNDGENTELQEDEKWLMALRDDMLESIDKTGVEARLLEYLIYRHLPDALYDNRVEERIAFVNQSFDEIIGKWKNTDGSFESLVECARAWSYDVEYDDEVLEKKISTAL